MDNGIELIVPLDVYRNGDLIEFVNNPDGTVSIMLKNIEKLVINYKEKPLVACQRFFFILIFLKLFRDFFSVTSFQLITPLRGLTFNFR